ncbi:MAG: histidine phosphatase family protein [Clostridia bacterium]|nr:histidine phosphatase family protein [Clostridia bacterium]
MKMYFVRHGHPDYRSDSLTELGHKQAQLAAERLSEIPLEKIFASTKGRAIQTAEYTAKKFDLPITLCDYMQELRWDSLDGEPVLANGHPWAITDIYASEGKTLQIPDWQDTLPYSNTQLVKCCRDIADGIDALLAEQGYTREGEYYRVSAEPTAKNIAMFSHAGASAAAFSHLFNIPFPAMCGLLHVGFTAITVVEFAEKNGERIYPKLISSDIHHVKSLGDEVFFGN